MFQPSSSVSVSSKIEWLVTFPMEISVGHFEKLMVKMKQEKQVTFHQIHYEKIGKNYHFQLLYSLSLFRA